MPSAAGALPAAAPSSTLDFEPTTLVLTVPATLKIQLLLHTDEQRVGLPLSIDATASAAALFDAVMAVPELAAVAKAHPDTEVVLAYAGGDTLSMGQQLLVYKALGLSLPSSHPLPAVVPIWVTFVSARANVVHATAHTSPDVDLTRKCDTVLRVKHLSDVGTLSGKLGSVDVTAVHVNASDTVATAKRILQQLLGVKVIQQELSTASRVLLDSDTIASIACSNITLMEMDEPGSSLPSAPGLRKFYAGSSNTWQVQTLAGMAAFFTALRMLPYIEGDVSSV